MALKAKPIRVWFALAFMMTACVAGDEGGTPDLTSQPTGEPPTLPAGHCGDGFCDGIETGQNCPLDCAGQETPLPSTGMPGYEPAINVFMVVHNDSDMDYETSTFQTTPENYRRSYNEINWLVDEAGRHNMRLTILYLGWYTRWALEQGDLSQFETILAAGHEIGTHVHPVTYDPDQGLWVGWPQELPKYGRPTYDAALSQQAWGDSHQYVAAVLEALGVTDQNRVVGPFPFMCSDEGMLLEEYGFSIAAGDRAEKGAEYFGHMVWNPFRPAANDKPGHEIEEDLSADFISIDHYAQIGAYEEVHPVNLTVGQLQRRFLMLYTEWLSRERTGAEDRVWVFGFVYHPNYTDRYHYDLNIFLDWLDASFIGKTSPHGNLIAQYATIGEIADQFTTWEIEHPGVSSFSYVQGDPYPYTYAVMPTLLDNAAYETVLNLGAGIQGYRFSRDGEPIYMLWSDTGEQEVDFSRELPGQVRVTDHTGAESVQDSSALRLTSDPLFVQPQ